MNTWAIGIADHVSKKLLDTQKTKAMDEYRCKRLTHRTISAGAYAVLSFYRSCLWPTKVIFS